MFGSDGVGGDFQNVFQIVERWSWATDPWEVFKKVYLSVERWRFGRRSKNTWMLSEGVCRVGRASDLDTVTRSHIYYCFLMFAKGVIYTENLQYRRRYIEKYLQITKNDALSK